MKFYEIIIKPKSAFITSLKGDTVFGNLCWFIKPISTLLQDYKTNPFMVVSSAIASFVDNGVRNYIFKRPCAPEEMLFTKADEESWVINRKERQKQNYFVLRDNEYLSNIKDIYKTDSEIIGSSYEKFYKNVKIQHNTINRETLTTGEKQFAPYTTSATFYNENFDLAIFVAIDESKFSKENLYKSFELLGNVGFGKKASTGYGKFEVLSFNESKFFSNTSNEIDYLYTLAPCVPKKEDIIEKESYFQPFTRFGKHGDIFAKFNNPFKKPIIMMDESALIKPSNSLNKNNFIIGSAITKVSYVNDNIVSQGYTLCLPLIK